ncbi:MAG: hypothetical protein QOJ35_312 [Solirubrobacteraceae bacterium]|nr:hypothetical protein [Solirubrobacteraceae bacterium]
MAQFVRFDAARVPRTPGRLRGQIEIAPDFDDIEDEMGDLFGVPR